MDREILNCSIHCCREGRCLTVATVAPLVMTVGGGGGDEGVSEIPVLYYESYDVLATPPAPPLYTLSRWPEVCSTQLFSLVFNSTQKKGSLPPQL